VSRVASDDIADQLRLFDRVELHSFRSGKQFPDLYKGKKMLRDIFKFDHK